MILVAFEKNKQAGLALTGLARELQSELFTPNAIVLK
jgi:hypothetical protein